MEAARLYAILEAPADKDNPDAGSLRSHLEAAARQGRRDARLDAGKIPEGFEYLWGLFCELRRGATLDGMSGTLRITWHDLADYQAVSGVRLDAFEVEAIMAMDQALLAEQAKKREGDDAS